MGVNEARQLVRDEGFEVIELSEEQDGVFVFACKGDDESDIIVSVIDGAVVIAPT